MPGKLIITADDYGLNQNVNQGIRDAVSAGIVTSVHVMANLVNQNDINLLKNAIQLGGNKCGIGLHINTTWGPAMIQEPASFKHSWGPYGAPKYFYRDLNTYKHGTIKSVPVEFQKMRNEIVAQFNYLSSLLGGAQYIDAISSHYNFHLWDYQFIEVVAELSNTNNIPVRSPIRWKTPQIPVTIQYPRGTRPLTSAGLNQIRGIIDAPSTIYLMSAPLPGQHKRLFNYLHSLKSLNVQKIAMNNSGHWFGQPSPDAIEWFVKTLSEMSLNNGMPNYTSEIYMHLSNSIFGGDDRYGYPQKKRLAEYAVIMRSSFKNNFNQWLQQYGVQHGSYRALL